MSNLKHRPSLLGRLMGQTDDSSSEKSSGSFEEQLPPLSPLVLTGYKDSTKNRLMTESLANDIRNLIPPRLQLYDNWHLIYSIEQHGISINTLYRNCDPEHQLQLISQKKYERGYGDSIIRSMINDRDDRNRRPIGYVMIIRDFKNNKFGCYLNEHLRPMEHKRYYGNGECFLWKTEHGSHEYGPHDRFKAFMYTGINDNIIYSNSQFIAIGSSDGKNGLWISATLEEGVSYECETFGNEVLNGHKDKTRERAFGKFKIRGLEIWRVGSLQ